MGQNYVAVDFGSPNAPPAAPDTCWKALEQPDLSTILAKLDNVATGVEGLTRSLAATRSTTCSDHLPISSRRITPA